jgi:hypothetical protein
LNDFSLQRCLCTRLWTWLDRSWLPLLENTVGKFFLSQQLAQELSLKLQPETLWKFWTPTSNGC